MQGSNIDVGMLVQLKDEVWLTNQRIAGKVAAKAIDLLVGLVKNGTTLTTSELDKKAEEFIRDNNCLPTFLGYKGHSSVPFPNSVCISVNKALVHGVCNDYVLQEGDLVSFDLGTTYRDAIADTATTVIVGRPKCEEHWLLVEATKKALKLAIKQVVIGKRLGVIGEAIYKHSVDCGYSCIQNYGGHFVGNALDGTPMPHMPPFVSNRSSANEGVRFTPGMAICIEPLFVIGASNNTTVADDHWTVICQDICAHEEHSIFISDAGVEVITARENE
jgi:methionyl aminopeptidase